MNTLQERSDALTGSACLKKAFDAGETDHAVLFAQLSVGQEKVKSS